MWKSRKNIFHDLRLIRWSEVECAKAAAQGRGFALGAPPTGEVDQTSRYSSGKLRPQTGLPQGLLELNEKQSGF